MGVEIACAHCGVSYDSEAHSTCPACEEKRAAELERMRNRRRVDQHAPARPAVCECPACREFVSMRAISCPSCGEPGPSIVPLTRRILYAIVVANIWTAVVAVIVWLILRAQVG
jgi:hypothetical protein